MQQGGPHDAPWGDLQVDPAGTVSVTLIEKPSLTNYLSWPAVIQHV